MALTGVLRPGHVAIRVLEMGPALKHYIDVLGLIETARDEKGRVFLKAWDEHDHHSVVLRETDEAGMDYLGWKVDSPATLKKLAGDIEKSKLCSDFEWIPKGEHPETGERFRFTIPTGHVMELFAEKKHALSESLRKVRPMKPSSESSNSRRSVSMISVGILV